MSGIDCSSVGISLLFTLRYRCVDDVKYDPARNYSMRCNGTFPELIKQSYALHVTCVINVNSARLIGVVYGFNMRLVTKSNYDIFVINVINLSTRVFFLESQNIMCLVKSCKRIHVIFQVFLFKIQNKENILKILCNFLK